MKQRTSSTNASTVAMTCSTMWLSTALVSVGAAISVKFDLQMTFLVHKFKITRRKINDFADN